MKKIKIILMILFIFSVTGCFNKNLNKVYDKMNKVDRYTVRLLIESNINDDYTITNYMNKNYKVVRNMGYTDYNYYLVNGKKYKQITNNKNTVDYNGNLEKETKLEETKEDIPYTNTNIYLTSLNKAKNINKIKFKEYETYEYTVSPKDMKEILKETRLKDIKINNDTIVTLKLDTKGYVYSIEYNLKDAVGSEDELSLELYYSNINNVDDIKLK